MTIMRSGVLQRMILPYVVKGIGHHRHCSQFSGNVDYGFAQARVWWDLNTFHPRLPLTICDKCASELLSSGCIDDIISITASGYDHTSISGQDGITHLYTRTSYQGDSFRSILLNMISAAKTDSPPMNYLLVSNNGDFARALKGLRDRRFNIIVGRNVFTYHHSFAFVRGLFDDLVNVPHPLNEVATRTFLSY